MSKYSYVVAPGEPPEADRCEVFHADAAIVASLRASQLADAAVADLAEMFRTLGDPTRVRILDALARHELCVCDIATLVGLTESAVSHQLRLLRHMRLVRARREGRMVYYALDDQHITELFAQGLRHVEEARPQSRRAEPRAGSRGRR